METFKSRLNMLNNEKRKQKIYQNQIAITIGIKPQAYSYLLKKGDMPNLKTIEKIAEYFDVSIEYLIGKSSVRSPEIIALKTVGLDTLQDHLNRCSGIAPNLITTLNRLLGNTVFNLGKVDGDMDKQFLQKLTEILNRLNIFVERAYPFSENLNVYVDENAAAVALYQTADLVRKLVIDYGEALITAYKIFKQNESAGETNGDN
jgi:transcriptional regulator with XRE-family HTH domain